ncbi:MAG TPA: N-6 DNA methylase, partial [Pyrinomonadaceae bacterium]
MPLEFLYLYSDCSAIHIAMELFPDKSYSQVVASLRDIGYREDLIYEGYTFVDWFNTHTPLRQIAAAAFGQTPPSYDSAVIGVVCANGLREQALIDQHRAFGAPIIIEIDAHEIREWAVSAQQGRHEIIDRYPIDKIRDVLTDRAPAWQPPNLLRTKNLGAFHWTYQLGLFAGLLPELEEQIQAKLEPLLKETLSVARSAYTAETGREPDATQLFKLAFWLLTAKVFKDRRVPSFIKLGPDPDVLLEAIARHYRTRVPRFLTRRAREEAAKFIWTILDFRNLSVEVLSQLWATFLLDAETRRRLGIYRTSRTIVRYILERTPFAHHGNDERIIFEPCSGSAGFLIGAMNKLRPGLFGMSGAQRHQYFRKHLAAMETEALGIEISRLALTLADFPNSNSWDIAPRDVFEPGAMADYLKRSSVVFCNPPFGEFEAHERIKYQVQSPYKAVELLNRVLNDLPEDGVLGFVMPRALIDGQSYKTIRRRLAERFGTLDVTALPDRAFENASAETCLLVASEPIPHKTCRVAYRKVSDSAQDWWRFVLRHELSFTHEAEFHPAEAEERLAIPDLPQLW